MAGFFPVDDGNLSFSGDNYEGLFITQGTFKNVTTQDVSDAVDYLNELTEVPSGEVLSQNSEIICSKIFDFSNDHDNGWSMSTRDSPIIVTCNFDGKQFVVGDEVTKSNEFEDKNVLPSVSKELENDLKCFNSIATAVELDVSKRKRSVFTFHD